MMVTSKSVRPSALAADKPPKPAPTMTTRGVVMAKGPPGPTLNMGCVWSCCILRWRFHRLKYFRAIDSIARAYRCGKRSRNTGTRMSQKVPVAAIRGLITDALAAAGLPRDDAAKCAELMGEADLTGADAHGVFRLPQY